MKKFDLEKIAGTVLKVAIVVGVVCLVVGMLVPLFLAMAKTFWQYALVI